MLLFFIPLVRFIFLAGFKHGEDYVRQLSCHPHNRLLRFHPLFIVEIGTAEAPVSVDANPGGLHNLRAEVLVTAECLFSMRNLPAAAMACRDKSKIGRELFFVMETVDVAYFCQKCHRHIDSHSGDGCQQLAAVSVAFASAQFPDISCRHQQCLPDGLNLNYQQIKRDAGR